MTTQKERDGAAQWAFAGLLIMVCGAAWAWGPSGALFAIGLWVSLLAFTVNIQPAAEDKDNGAA